MKFIVLIAAIMLAPLASAAAPPLCDTTECAELVAKHAYDLCIAARKVPAVCTQRALNAWIATGALPPYAHGCMSKNWPKDYLGRCDVVNGQ